jgi:hypothetical protein
MYLYDDYDDDHEGPFGSPLYGLVLPVGIILLSGGLLLAVEWILTGIGLWRQWAAVCQFSYYFILFFVYAFQLSLCFEDVVYFRRPFIERIRAILEFRHEVFDRRPAVPIAPENKAEARKEGACYYH